MGTGAARAAIRLSYLAACPHLCSVGKALVSEPKCSQKVETNAVGALCTALLKAHLAFNRYRAHGKSPQPPRPVRFSLHRQTCVGGGVGGRTSVCREVQHRDPLPVHPRSSGRRVVHCCSSSATLVGNDWCKCASIVRLQPALHSLN